MTTLKDVLSLCRNLVADGHKFHYNEHGAIYDEAQNGLYHVMIRQVYPTKIRVVAEAMFERKVGDRLVRIIYNSSYNHFRGASRRDRWARRLITAACGLPRWQRPTVEKYRQ